MLNFNQILIDKAKKDLNEKKYIIYDVYEWTGDYSLDEAIKYVDKYYFGIAIKISFEDAVKLSEQLHRIAGDNNG